MTFDLDLYLSGICLYCVRFPTCIEKPGTIFRAVNMRQTSCTTCRDSARLWFAWRRSWHCLDWFPQSLLSCHGVLQRRRAGNSVCCFKNVPTWWLCMCDTLPSVSSQRVFVLLSMLSGEIYLRLKPHLVVEISSDIVTEHCCQVCVLSMMFCHSDCQPCADMVSDCAIRKLLWVPRGLTPLPQAIVGYKKYSLHLIFTFYLNRDTTVIELFPVLVFQ